MTGWELYWASIGMVAGTAVLVLALAQLSCEHAGSPVAQRLTTVMFAAIASYTAIDCWDVWAGVDNTLDTLAVAFCVVLALSWGYRRIFGLTSQRRPSPAREMIAADLGL